MGTLDCLHSILDLNNEILGDFLVCPFSVEKKGHMRMVCVEEAQDLTVKTWPRDENAVGPSLKKGPSHCPLGTGHRRHE
jgi:hypothetical protein